MTGHGAKFSQRKKEAIQALLTQRNVEEAARVSGIGTQTLYRWMKDPEFEAAYRKARHGNFRQAMARLRQAAGAAVTTLLKTMIDPGAPAAARLQAAALVLSHARDTIELEEIQARLAALKQAREASKAEAVRRPADARGSAPMAGHGAKFGRKKEAAIVALLTQRNVEEAARVSGIGTQTLYRWIEDPEFEAAYRKAGGAAFGQASARLQQAAGAAVTTLLKIMVDPGAPAGMHVRAAALVINHARDAVVEEIEAVLDGGGRTFDAVGRERPRLAA